MRKFGMFFGGGAILLLVFGVAGGQPPQRGKGGFGGFGGGMFGGGGPTDSLTLLRNPSVKKELDVSEEQMEKLPAAINKALGEVLNDKQVKRLRQIELQQRGTAAFKDETVAKELKITDEQSRNIDTILEDSRKEMAEIFKEAKGGNFQGLGEKMAGARKETTEKVMAVLSADQKKAWKAMTGPEFKLEARGFGGGAFGKKNKDQ